MSNIDAMKQEFKDLKQKVQEYSAEKRQEVLGRYKSLGVAMSNNDLEWATLYNVLHEEKDGTPVDPSMWEQIVFKGAGSLEPRTLYFMIDQGLDLRRLYEASRPGESDAAVELIDIVQVLIHKKANDLVKALVDDGLVSIEHANPFSEGIIQQALAYDNLELADWALSKGADINRTNIRTLTPLHQSAINMRLDAIAWCMANGADPTIETFQGTTASEVVPDNGDPACEELYEILEDYAAAYASGIRSHVDPRLETMRAPEEENEAGPSNARPKAFLP